MTSDRFSFRVLAPAPRGNGRPGHAEILPCLLIGEYPTPEDAEWLRVELGVGAVVCLQDEADMAGKMLSPNALRAAYAAQGIEFQHFPVADGDGDRLAAALEGVVAAIHSFVRAGVRVYVHCNAGMNRAPTVAIAYLHVHQGMALPAACGLVKQRRLCLPYMSVLERVYGEQESRDPGPPAVAPPAGASQGRR